MSGYRHNTWAKGRRSKPAAKAAVRRALKLAKTVKTSPSAEIAEGDLCRYKPPGREQLKENATALPVRGGSWIIDSGSAFGIVSPGDLTPFEKRRIEKMSMGIQLRTAAGDLTTDESVSVNPFGGNDTIDALVLPDSPALLSLGKLCGESGYSFYWPSGGSPEITLPSGKKFELDVVNRVPVWPMGVLPSGGKNKRGKRKNKTGCPVSQTGGASSSSDHVVDRAGQPVAEHAAPEKEDEIILEGDVPPEHYLTHMPKHAKCETCQASKMQHRQRRRKDEDHEIDKYPAKKFGDVITADHLSSYAEESISIDGDTFAIVLRDKYTGWLDCYATGSKSAEDATEALQHFVGPTEKLVFSTPTMRQS